MSMSAEDERISACRSVLVEAMTVLARYVEATVIVGGWVPELLYPGRGHVGSLDVDLALDSRKLAPHVYETVARALLEAGYRQKPGASHVFLRDIERTGDTIEVRLDLITGEGSGSESSGTSELIQGMMVSRMRGIDLALDHIIETRIKGRLPGGELIERDVRIPTAAAFLCTKAIAMSERKKEKDAYDIYFCLLNDPRGPRALGADCARLGDLANVRHAIDIIRRDFFAIDQNGPVWAGRFSAEHGADAGFATRDAYERARAFLESYDESC